jgi:hypothetical protein
MIGVFFLASTIIAYMELVGWIPVEFTSAATLLVLLFLAV